MSNLSGSDFTKQVKNASIRLDRRGTGGRFNKDNSNLTYSNELKIKRDMYLNDFKGFLEEKNEKGKLNTLLTPTNVQEFLENRLSNLSANSKLDYSSGFSSLLSGLEQTKVTIPANTKDTINSFTKSFREDFNNVKSDFKKDRAIKDKDSFLSELRDKRESSYIIASVQLETGLRVSEAIEVVNNLDKYLDNNILNNIVGKGGQEYNTKEISYNLINDIEKLDKNVSYSTYQGDLKSLDTTSHDLRITYALDTFNELEQKVGRSEALQTVSEELNHHRSDITTYYLNRA